jgi:parallel beta-helix repeat protein
MTRFHLSTALLMLGSLVGFVLISGVAATNVDAASVRRVRSNGSDSGDCIASPCGSIGYAVEQAAAGDTVDVGPGVYQESLLIEKAVTLLGSGATIDGTGHDNAILIRGAGAAGTVVQGFTVQNALLEGILAMQTSHLAIRDNVVMNNDALWDPVNVPEPCQKSDDCGEAVHLMTVTHSVVDGNTVKNNVGGILLTDEMGPTAWNTVSNNVVSDNDRDCGITLPSHFVSPMSVVTPDQGGIYNNTIIGNTVTNNGAAGIGIFAGPPGAAAYNNVVVNNTITGNGLPGVALHAHAPNQRLDGNAIVNNVIANNGADPDVMSDDTTGISVGSVVAPVASVSIKDNTISDEHYGIFLANVASTAGISDNVMTSVVEALTNLPSIPESNLGVPEEGAGGETGGGGEVTPPNTGDGGLADSGGSSSLTLLLAALLASGALAGAGAYVRIRR